MSGELRWLDRSPCARRYAELTAPASPSLAEHNPATATWRDLPLDPGLHGLAPTRPSPHRMEIVLAEAPGRDGRTKDGRWTVPLSGMLATPLAWHPGLPLVAGLLRRAWRAYPWVADHAARTVTVFDRVPTATGLTGLGGAPLAWCGDRLALLTRPDEPPHDEPPAPPGGAQGAPGGSGAPSGPLPAAARPVVMEAVGPGAVEFLPGVGELRARAAACVGLLDLADGAVTSYGAPLLVRGLHASRADGDVPPRLNVEYTTGEADGSTPGSPRFRWERALLAPGRPGPSPAFGPTAAEAPPSTMPEPANAELSQDVPHVPDVRRRSSRLPGPGGHGAAHLTLLAADDEGPTALWINHHAAPLEEAACGEAPAWLTASCGRVGVLDLALDWPREATPRMLHAQISDAVAGACEALGAGPVAVGGHSFGATLALYAAAHLPRFTCVFAHSGCYNRTHTLTGFQQELRPYWEAPEVYHAFSAVHFADRLTLPVLLVHGSEDANPATPADQSVALYRALVAAGGHARLMLLPYEGHTPYYRETHESLTAEHHTWLTRWTHTPREG